jgi:hypothetical protein
MQPPYICTRNLNSHLDIKVAEVWLSISVDPSGQIRVPEVSFFKDQVV